MNLCPNGHDKDVVGVASQDRCKPCFKISCRKSWVKWYAKHGVVANRAKMRRSYGRNVEKRRAEAMERYWKNREKRLAQMRAWRMKQKALYGSERNAFWGRLLREDL